MSEIIKGPFRDASRFIGWPMWPVDGVEYFRGPNSGEWVDVMGDPAPPEIAAELEERVQETIAINTAPRSPRSMLRDLLAIRGRRADPELEEAIALARKLVKAGKRRRVALVLLLPSLATVIFTLLWVWMKGTHG